jgi:hypothetical protein
MGGTYWTRFLPSLETVACSDSASIVAEARREIEQLTGDEQTESHLNYLIDCLDECDRAASEKRSPDPAMAMALIEMDRLTAFRLFGYFPHPALEAVTKEDPELESKQLVRELCEISSFWLIARELDLKLCLAWLGRNFSATKPYANLVEERYRTIRGLFEYGAIQSRCSIPALWLAQEYHRSKQRMQNLDTPMSINEAQQQARANAVKMQQTVTEGTRLGIAGAHDLEAYAARFAAINQKFDKEYHSKLLLKYKSWAKGIEKLKLVNPPKVRGRGSPGRRKAS